MKGAVMIPPTVSGAGPMLAVADPGPPDELIARLDRAGGYRFDVKWDGHRCRAVVEAGAVRLASRTGTDVTRAHPGPAAGLRAAVAEEAVLDGELVCFDRDGRPSLAAVSRRGAKSVFVAFDLLFTSSSGDLRSWPYQDRSAALDRLIRPNDAVRLTVASDDGAALWESVRQLGLEGVIAKRRASRYVAGRSNAWIKVKARRRVSALVTGVVTGQGTRADAFGALVVSLLDPAGRPVEVASVGSGFTRHDLLALSRRLAAGAEPVMIEVEYLTLGADGRLREPVFKGVRLDLDPTDCRTDQLDDTGDRR